MLSIGNVIDLPVPEQELLDELVNVLNAHNSKNRKKIRYYEGHVTVREVNLDIALPKGLSRLEVGCAWGQKCVDVLAARSMFDGFVGQNGEPNDLINQIVENNSLVYEYQKATRDELKFGSSFATLAMDQNKNVSIRFHSPMEASGLWDGENGRLKAGLAIMDSVPDESQKDTWRPSMVNLYTDTATWVLERPAKTTRWFATGYSHKMGRPLMVAMTWDATSNKPFGRSRLKKPIRSLIDGYIRTIADAAIALEFDTTPQKYLLGVSDDQYDAITSDKFKQYVGAILTSTSNPETGENPEFGQLPQGNIEPHIQMLRSLATQFSAATGLTVSDTGVVNDANPTSSDAILAQSQTLITLAEQLNSGNATALKKIALMAQAMQLNTTLEDLDENYASVIAHYKNPAMPSVASTADAAIKISSARPNFAGTDIFLEMLGFDQADIRRIKAQEERIKGSNVLTEEFTADNEKNANTGQNLATGAGDDEG
ncbi:phage portal protein [Lactobacillus hominis]|uniref:phage portal protein n=1 Tax=Lactobacillus hominis TaxID=1203033 RepID=UPI0023F1DCC6|nr:phage portal protein [Lactobacillus hominis]